MLNILINLMDTSDKYKQKIFDSNFLKKNFKSFKKIYKSGTRVLLYNFMSKLTENIKFGNAQEIIKMNFFEFCIDALYKKQTNEINKVLKCLRNVFDCCEFLKSLNNNNINAFMKVFSDKGGKSALQNLVNHPNYDIYILVNGILKEFENYDL